MFTIRNGTLARLLLSLAGLCSAEAAWPLVALTTEALPFSYTAPGGEVVGVSADVVAEMARRAALPLVIDNRRPWARAMWDAQHLADTCAFSVSREAGRETLYQWIGPIANNRWALFARADFAGKVETIADAKRYRVGGLRADAKTEFLAARGVDVETVGNDRSNAAKLGAGRIDLWVSGVYTAQQTAEAVGVHGIKLVLVFHETPSYLACSHGTSADTVHRLADALVAMRRDGFVTKAQAFHRGRFGW